MEILWACGGQEVTGRQVADVLPDYAYTTVATVLDRLVRKGVVQRRMVGRRVLFTPVGTEGARAAMLMREALSDGGDRSAALAQFVRTLSPEEVAVLRDTLDAFDERAGAT
jgi:predicted transcriptional regulator